MDNNYYIAKNTEKLPKSYLSQISIQYGWVCPKCGRVYSPTTALCLACYETVPIITTWASSTNVGGSDYWDEVNKTWTNVVNDISNMKETNE